jgi:hypothetical protein
MVDRFHDDEVLNIYSVSFLINPITNLTQWQLSLGKGSVSKREVVHQARKSPAQTP